MEPIFRDKNVVTREQNRYQVRVFICFAIKIALQCKLPILRLVKNMFALITIFAFLRKGNFDLTLQMPKFPKLKKIVTKILRVDPNSRQGKIF